MGRGLSELQTWILTKAAEPKHRNHRPPDWHLRNSDPEPGYPQCDLTTSHVIREFYGVKATHRRGDPEWTDQIFRGGSADEAQRRRPAVARAFARLEERGLVTRVGNDFWTGICLTDAGRELAEAAEDAGHDPGPAD